MLPWLASRSPISCTDEAYSLCLVTTAPTRTFASKYTGDASDSPGSHEEYAILSRNVTHEVNIEIFPACDSSNMTNEGIEDLRFHRGAEPVKV